MLLVVHTFWRCRASKQICIIIRLRVLNGKHFSPTSSLKVAYCINIYIKVCLEKIVGKCVSPINFEIMAFRAKFMFLNINDLFTKHEPQLTYV